MFAVADEVTIPILPCRELDDAVSFYEALGFDRTYRQSRPNPYAVVVRDDIQIHLFGLDDFDPERSTGNVIVAVPDPDQLYETFAHGLRTTFGKLPSAGIPRIVRPRKKFGTVRGFSVVDPGGNWLRFSKLGDTEEEANREKSTGLARVIDNAARQGDARGDDGAAMQLLDQGLVRFPDAPAVDRVRTHLYRTELAVRMGNRPLAHDALAAAHAIALTGAERVSVEADVAHASEVVETLS